MIFDYNEQPQFMDSIDIVDIGDTALRCISDQQDEYYIIFQTSMGKTRMLKFGPLIPDCDFLGDDYDCLYRKFDYKEATIRKEINSLINNPKLRIVEVEEIPPLTALNYIPNINQLYMKE